MLKRETHEKWNDAGERLGRRAWRRFRARRLSRSDRRSRGGWGRRERVISAPMRYVLREREGGRERESARARERERGRESARERERAGEKGGGERERARERERVEVELRQYRRSVSPVSSAAREIVRGIRDM